MSRPTDDQQIVRFLDVLRQKGGSAGNYAMMNELDLNEAEYWRVRNKVLDRGFIMLGRGRGGSVSIVAPNVSEDQTGSDTPNTSYTTDTEANPKYPTEQSLYEPCLTVLESQWASMHRLFDFKAQVTANQGRKKTGGIWTRPDIAGLSLRTFPYWPGRHFDLWTFEIKPRESFNVLGLFEALAHARSATHSWALYHVDEQMLADPGGNSLDRMTAEAQRLGVGLIVFTDPAEFSTWDIRVLSSRQSPDPSLHDEFVKTQLSEDSRELLLQWAR